MIYYNSLGNIDPSLITALVEIWRAETHTFYLPHGECTITLEDVSLKLGVNVNDLPIVGPTYFDWNEICEEVLGKVPGDEQDMRGCEWGQRNLNYRGIPRGV
ncbi:hypothetical protein Lal_00019034 [Lupinus albus]|nr:hypothetical protein Lal_00019034 [Lupinus albus]